MKNIVHCFSQELTKCLQPIDVYQALADCFEQLDKNIYAVCLRIDTATFEFTPVRDVDRVLMKNIQPCLEKGICGQILASSEAVIVSDHHRFAIKENEYVLLAPIFYGQIQHGVVLIVFPRKLMNVFEDARGDFNSVSVLASKFYDMMHSLQAERRVAEQLSESEGRLNNIVQNVVHGLFALDNNHTVIIFNKNAEIIFGIAASAVIGKSYREAFPDKLVRTFDLLIESTLIEGSILDYEVEIEIAPTLKIPVGISSSVLLDNQGINQGVVCVCRDMSLTKEVNRLKEINQMKTEFVSMVSHELKNPIAIIKSSVETLLAARKMGKDLGPDFENNTLLNIAEEINRLAQLINDILNLSRIEAGKVEIRKEPTNIGKLLQETVHIFKLSETTHPITIDADGTTEEVLLDQDKIKQVIINYVGNAIKYSPAGSPITIRAWQEEDSMKITISDQGIGIPEDKMNDVFEKFSRVATPETVSISGTGLGLSICKKIIELHFGQVWAESEYHKGSTFGFSLPTSGLGKEPVEKGA